MPIIIIRLISTMYECGQGAIAANNLNLPTYEMHTNESRDQVLVNLHMLAYSFDTISGRLINKSKQQNQRIEALKARLMACRQQISGLENLNQALTFVSPPEYPVSYKFEPEKNPSMFADYFKRIKLNKFDMQAHYQMKHDMERLGQESKIKVSQLNQFITFLYGQLRTKKKTLFERGVPQKKHYTSLGRIPKSLRYVDSLSIFNSEVNPYRSYQLIDNSMKVTEKKKPQHRDETIELDMEQPIATFQQISYEQDSKKYVPVEKIINMIDFDDDIGLEGIVSLDLGFEENVINPSNPDVLKKNISKDTYSPVKQPQSNPPSQQQQAQSQSQPRSQPYQASQSNPAVSQPPSNSGNLLPPPPPQNLSLGSLPPPPPPPPKLNSSLPLPPPIGGNSMLPPPPIGKVGLPPPPIVKPTSALATMNQPVMPSGGSGNRSALLDQIQCSNPMARLKKTVTKETPAIMSKKQDSQNPASAQGGDQNPSREMNFMEALQAKIRNRFKALHPERGDDDDDE